MENREPDTCTFTASKFKRAEMEQLLKVLESMGLDISYKFSDSGRTVEIAAHNLPDPKEATLKRTRGAGRKGSYLNPPASSPFNSDTPCTDFLEWRQGKGITVEKAAEALGISRATYHRQKIEQQMRNLIAEYAEINPRREAKGWPTLTATLGKIKLGTNSYYSDNYGKGI